MSLWFRLHPVIELNVFFSSLHTCIFARQLASCFSAVTLFLQIAATIAMFSLIAFDYDILPTDVGDIYFDIRTNKDFRRGLAWRHRESGDDDIIQV